MKHFKDIIEKFDALYQSVGAYFKNLIPTVQGFCCMCCRTTCLCCCPCC